MVVFGAGRVAAAALIGLVVIAVLAFAVGRVPGRDTSSDTSMVSTRALLVEPTETPPKPMPSAFTPEPYPRPPRPRTTAKPTRTADPTRVALTSAEWAEELKQLWIAAGDLNYYVEGPFDILATADV